MIDNSENVDLNIEILKYFDMNATTWSTRYASRGHFRHRFEIVMSLLDDVVGCASQPPRVLDFGCGSGVFMGALLRRGAAVYGVDISKNMIKECYESFKNLPDRSYDLELISGPDFGGDYLSQTYDAVLCLAVIEYVDQPPLLLERLASVVRPGGFLIISAPNRDSLLRRAERFAYNRLRRLGTLPQLEGLYQKLAYLDVQKHQFSIEEINNFMRKLGCSCRGVVYHVSPRVLGPLECSRRVGMKFIAKYSAESHASSYPAP